MLLFLTGLLAGVVSGMGIGGGAVLIPALVILAKPEQHIAQSVNLLFFIPTAIVALIVHCKNKSIQFKTAIPLIIFGLIGAWLGSKLAISLPGNSLKKYFAVFLFVMGIIEILKKEKTDKPGKLKAK